MELNEFFIITNIEKKQSMAGAVYVIQDASSLFKIGRTRNLAARLAQIKSTNPTATLVGGFWSENCSKSERVIHRVLDHCRVHGEWFICSEETIKKILGIYHGVYIK